MKAPKKEERECHEKWWSYCFESNRVIHWDSPVGRTLRDAKVFVKAKCGSLACSHVFRFLIVFPIVV